jgi:hypothetical protein
MRLQCLCEELLENDTKKTRHTVVHVMPKSMAMTNSGRGRSLDMVEKKEIHENIVEDEAVDERESTSSPRCE